MNTLNATATVIDFLTERLNERKAQSLFRSLQVQDGLIDFCSNDYISFARSEAIRENVKALYAQHEYLSGATGSRSISGNTTLAEEFEKELAAFHHAEAALLFNSGYNVNVGLFSCIAGREDTLITDELIHASIIDGCRLSHAKRLKFAHNDVADLEKKLALAKGNIFVVVESVYSMDGDMAPLPDIVELCERYAAHVIVDEAHATGVFGKQGRGLVNEAGLEERVFARVHTFGKAMGCHGAVVVGPAVLRDFLINYSRSFIFTTALPVHSLITARCAYNELRKDGFTNSPLHDLIAHFRARAYGMKNVRLIESKSPIQSVLIPGSEQARNAALFLQKKGFDVRAILSPSVPPGTERLRISLHLHNTADQVDALLNALSETLSS